MVVVMAADTMVEKAKRCQHHSTMFGLFLALILKVLTLYVYHFVSRIACEGGDGGGGGCATELRSGPTRERERSMTIDMSGGCQKCSCALKSTKYSARFYIFHHVSCSCRYYGKGGGGGGYYSQGTMTCKIRMLQRHLRVQ